MKPFQRFALGAAMFTLPLLAAEEGGGHAEVGMIWKVLNFLILAGLLGYLLGKTLGPALASNRQSIADGLAAGEKAKQDAEVRAAAVQARLSNLEGEVANMRARAREERDREADRIRQDAQNEMARIKSQAEMEIESAGKQATLELKRYAAKLALDLAEQKVRARMSPDTQSQLVAGFRANIAATARPSTGSRA